jgi:hypothetical protein
VTVPLLSAPGKHTLTFTLSFPSYFSLSDLMNATEQIVAELEKFPTTRNGGVAVYHKVENVAVDRG